MTRPSLVPAAPAQPAEVVAFAAQKGVDRYLDDMIGLTRRAFPSSAVTVSVGRDAEEEEHQYIAIDVDVHGMDAAELLAGQRAWTAGVSRVCPSRHAVYFVLGWR